MFRFGDLIAHDTTDCCTCSGSQQAPAQHIAGNATNDGTRGRAFFLLGHARATTQGEHGGNNGGCNWNLTNRFHSDTYLVSIRNKEILTRWDSDTHLQGLYWS